jgi:hypothetical protein
MRFTELPELLVDQAEMQKIVRIAEHLAEPLKLEKKSKMKKCVIQAENSIISFTQSALEDYQE